MPGNVLMTILANASNAPVFPAEITPAASPADTASMASRMEEFRSRKAAVGFMSPPTTSGACRIVKRVGTRVCASRGASRASSPTTRNVAVGCRSAAITNPSITTAGARSPPIASTARV